MVSSGILGLGYAWLPQAPHTSWPRNRHARAPPCMLAPLQPRRCEVPAPPAWRHPPSREPRYIGPLALSGSELLTLQPSWAPWHPSSPASTRSLFPATTRPPSPEPRCRRFNPKVNCCVPLRGGSIGLGELIVEFECSARHVAAA